MEFEKGRVVVSKAGRDKGRLLAIVAIDDGVAFVADGRLRKAVSPKKKNLRHLSLTETVLNEEALGSDALIRKALERTEKSRESVKEA